MLHGFTIADLADQYDVGRLSQRVLQRVLPVAGIHTHFALIHDGLFVPMYKFDRVLNRDDMPAGVAVAIVDHSRQRGRFT